MTEQPKYPKGRPPKSKNVLLKSTMEPIKEEPPIVPEETKVEPIVEKKEEIIEVKEKKPRSEQQILATKRLVEANKAKRKITIIDSKLEPKTEPKPEPKPEQNLYDKLKQMEEKLAIMEQQKSKKKTKPEPKSDPEPKPKPKEPKPKKIQRVESSESESSTESESESDDEAYVEKYKQKAERRFQAVQAIEQRLQAAKVKPKGKYDHLSLF